MKLRVKKKIHRLEGEKKNLYRPIPCEMDSVIKDCLN